MQDRVGLTQNMTGTCGKIDTPLTQPGSPFGLYHARRDLIAKRNATSDPVKREQINILLEQLANYDREDDQEIKSQIGVNIDRQMKLMAD